jgi:hypothetical protein
MSVFGTINWLDIGKGLLIAFGTVFFLGLGGVLSIHFNTASRSCSSLLGCFFMSKLPKINRVITNSKAIIWHETEFVEV